MLWSEGISSKKCYPNLNLAKKVGIGNMGNLYYGLYYHNRLDFPEGQSTLAGIPEVSEERLTSFE
jgi:hypothetical protein